jgi:predicted nucleic acid-binding protein
LKVFVDTGAFIARFNSRDEHHNAAVEYLHKIESGEAGVHRLYTSDYVVDETITTIFARTSSFDIAKSCGESIITSRAIERLPIGEEIFMEAWQLFKRRGEVGLSFTDATSAVLMRRRGLSAIFAFDGHFAKLGMLSLP